jgi:hypothetical protein
VERVLAGSSLKKQFSHREPSAESRNQSVRRKIFPKKQDFHQLYDKELQAHRLRTESCEGCLPIPLHTLIFVIFVANPLPFSSLPEKVRA